MAPMITVKNIVLTVFALPIVWIFTVSVPLWIVASGLELFPMEIGILRFIGWIPIILGGAAFLWCYGIFVLSGRGTPWPFDPPKKLVITGLYRFVSNPMAVSCLLIWSGEVMLFESSALILYAFLNYIFLSMLIVLFEEPAQGTDSGRHMSSIADPCLGGFRV